MKHHCGESKSPTEVQEERIDDKNTGLKSEPLLRVGSEGKIRGEEGNCEMDPFSGL